jgi:hypothetical protein
VADLAAEKPGPHAPGADVLKVTRRVGAADSPAGVEGHRVNRKPSRDLVTAQPGHPLITPAPAHAAMGHRSAPCRGFAGDPVERSRALEDSGGDLLRL